MNHGANHGARYARHAGNVASMLEAARQVMASRLSAEAAQARGPVLTALENGRMVPEKMLAFTASGAALAQGGTELARRAMEYGFTEAAAAHHAWMRLASSRSPLGWAMAQAEWASGAATRAAGFSAGFGTAALAVAEDALRPVSRTVSGNLRRLG